jgi:uncharacterized protein (DUF1778 family)
MNTLSGARLDLTMDVAEKEVLARGAALMGTTMAAFVRYAAKEKARELIERESRITMSDRDFEQFSKALTGKFKPNAALKAAIDSSRTVKRA